MKKIVLLFTFFIALFSLLEVSFADNGSFSYDLSPAKITVKEDKKVVFDENSKTIKELKNDLDKIEKKEEIIFNKIENFIKDSNLKEYVRRDLTIDEKRELEKLIANYNFEKSAIEKEMWDYIDDTEKLKVVQNNLLDKKVDLYKKMTSFIKPEKYSLYLEYIKSDTDILTEKKDIETEKVETKTVINKRVEILEEKIKEHKVSLENDIKKLINKKLEEKITSLENNQDFIILTTKNKIKLLDKTIAKAKNKLWILKEQLKKLEKPIFLESYKLKINVYELSIKKLVKFREKVIKTRK